jgi:hypothetical protein
MAEDRRLELIFWFRPGTILNTASRPRQGSLSDADFDRLLKLLGMSGSASNGEALNAIRLANRLLRDRGLTWPEAIERNVDGPVPEPEPPPRPAPTRPPAREFAAWGDWRDAAAACARDKCGALTVWERHFAASVLGFPFISARQRETLIAITRKLERAGAAV